MPSKDIFQAATDILKDVYGKINGGITLLCVVFITICLIGMTISKNQKTVDEFRAWGKRIAWAWVIFFTLAPSFSIWRNSGLTISSIGMKQSGNARVN